MQYGKKEKRRQKEKGKINWCAIGTKKLILGGKLVDEAMNSGQTNFLSYTSTGFAAFFSRLSSVFCSCFPHAQGCSMSLFCRSGGIAAADTPFCMDMAEARATGIKQSPLFWRYRIALVMLVSISFTTSSSKTKLSSGSSASSNPCALVVADRGWPW